MAKQSSTSRGQKNTNTLSPQRSNVKESLSWLGRWESRLSFTVSPLLVATLVNIVLFGIVYFFWLPNFNTSDDRAMMLLSAGKLIALEPTEYLIFTNILLGHLLKALYTAFPAVYWYPLYLISGLFLGYTAILYSILKRRPSALSLMVYTLAFAILGGYMLLALQFTMVATIVGFGGMALLLIPSISPEDDSDKKVILSDIFPRMLSGAGIVGALLLTLSAMIRWESFLLVMVLVLPLLLLHLVQSSSNRQRLATLALVAIGVSFAGVSQWYHQYRYEHWGAFNYLQFNRLFGEFSDFKLFKRVPFPSQKAINEMCRSTANWSNNDTEMLMNEFYMDENLYTISSMQNLINGVKKYEQSISKNPSHRYYATALPFYEGFTTKLWQRQRNLLLSDVMRCALVLLLVVVVISEMELLALFALAATLGAVYGVLIYVNYLTLMRDAADRVFYPIFFFMSFVALLVAKPIGTRRIAQSAARAKNGLSILALCLCLYALWHGNAAVMSYYRNISDEIRGGEDRFRQAVTALQPKKENLYVIWAYGFPFRDMPPFCDLSVFNNFRALWLMWAQRTPTTKQLLDSYGIRDIYKALSYQKNVMFVLSLNQIGNPELQYPRRFAEFMDTHYQIKIVARPPDHQPFITNINEGKNGNPYTTFRTVSLDTLAAQQSEQAGQFKQPSQQTR
jgi:hypothetical protein